jgi:cytochrome c-type biogenesis protein CcmE
VVEVEQDREALLDDEESSSHGHRLRWLVLGIVVALSVGYLVYAAFPGNTLYFLTVGEFLAQNQYQDGRPVRVAGTLVEGSFQRPGNSTSAYFQLADKNAGPGGNHLSATYVGVLPDLFFNPQSEIIVQGSQGPDNVFQVETILVKCPSKYQALEEGLPAEATSS